MELSLALKRNFIVNVMMRNNDEEYEEEEPKKKSNLNNRM
jgi:hypothetical protein